MHEVSCNSMASARRTPLSEQAVTAWARFLRVSQQLLARVEADLKAAGLPPLSWYDVLLELGRDKVAGLRPFQLEERVLLAQYNVSRLVDRLVGAGYVERRQDDNDGRGQVVKITRKGRALLEEMWPVYRASIAERFARPLDPSEIDALATTLSKLARPSG